MASRAGVGGILTRPDQKYTNPTTSSTSTPGSLTSAYGTYGSAVGGDNSTYDGMMSDYTNLFNTIAGRAGQTLNPDLFNYKPYNYTQSADYIKAFGGLSKLAENGGYSDEDIANLRERAVSPIRSIYGNANREVDRSRSLQGGYSPSFGALKAKMARESSEQLGNALTGANADIAEKQATGKLTAGGELASLASSENALRNSITEKESNLANEYGFKNTEIGNQAKMFNFMYPMQQNDQLLKILQGKSGLYGTTPARSSLFGSQALSSAGLQNNITQANRSRMLDFFKTFMSGLE